MMNGQQATNGSEQLRDIKPLLEIPDNSYIIFWGLILFAIILALIVLFFAIKKFLEHRKANLAKKYLAKLHIIDWKDAKESAYTATHYARLLATDGRREELFDQLEGYLEQYKYKKEVESVDDQTLKQFNLFVQVCDESV